MPFKVYAELDPGGRHYAPEVPVSSSVAAAQAAGRAIISQAYVRNGVERTRVFEEINMPGELTLATSVRGVVVRNHTTEELAIIRTVLNLVPLELLGRFSNHYNGIVCVDWTGAEWRDAARPNRHSLLNGGANISRTVVREGVTESGLRIELTHSALHELRAAPHNRRGVFTLWHELGHVAFRNRFTPRHVERDDYGDSVHVGREEQPAYAFMWYFLDRRRLTEGDRAAFHRILAPYETHPPTHILERIFPLREPEGELTLTRRGWRRPGTCEIIDNDPVDLP